MLIGDEHNRNNHTIVTTCGETFKLYNKGQSVPTAEEVQLSNLKDKIENTTMVFQEAAKQRAVAEAMQQQQEGIETYRTLFYALVLLKVIIDECAKAGEMKINLAKDHHLKTIHLPTVEVEQISQARQKWVRHSLYQNYQARKNLVERLQARGYEVFDTEDALTISWSNPKL